MKYLFFWKKNKLYLLQSRGPSRLSWICKCWEPWGHHVCCKSNTQSGQHSSIAWSNFSHTPTGGKHSRTGSAGASSTLLVGYTTDGPANTSPAQEGWCCCAYINPNTAVATKPSICFAYGKVKTMLLLRKDIKRPDQINGWQNLEDSIGHNISRWYLSPSILQTQI